MRSKGRIVKLSNKPNDIKINPKYLNPIVDELIDIFDSVTWKKVRSENPKASCVTFKSMRLSLMENCFRDQKLFRRNSVLELSNYFENYFVKANVTFDREFKVGGILALLFLTPAIARLMDDSSAPTLFVAKLSTCMGLFIIVLSFAMSLHKIPDLFQESKYKEMAHLLKELSIYAAQ
jgi:hypothetical protein